MKANELRIGNWVYAGVNFQDSDVSKPTGLIPYRVEIGFTGTSNFYPIPLTPEILEKAGFTKVIARKSDESYVCNGVWVNPRNGGFYSYANSKIETLHQLQNLYFALTGEELQIEL